MPPVFPKNRRQPSDAGCGLQRWRAVVLGVAAFRCRLPGNGGGRSYRPTTPGGARLPVPVATAWKPGARGRALRRGARYGATANGLDEVRARMAPGGARPAFRAGKDREAGCRGAPRPPEPRSGASSVPPRPPGSVWRPGMQFPLRRGRIRQKGRVRPGPDHARCRVPGPRPGLVVWRGRREPVGVAKCRRPAGDGRKTTGEGSTLPLRRAADPLDHGRGLRVHVGLRVRHDGTGRGGLSPGGVSVRPAHLRRRDPARLARGAHRGQAGPPATAAAGGDPGDRADRRAPGDTPCSMRFPAR